MPMGIKQQNDMFRATIDVWEDKIFLNEKEYPAGHFAAEILNISNEFIVASAGKAQDLLTILPGVSYADRDALKTMLPTLKRFLGARFSSFLATSLSSLASLLLGTTSRSLGCMLPYQNSSKIFIVFPYLSESSPCEFFNTTLPQTFPKVQRIFSGLSG